MAASVQCLHAMFNSADCRLSSALVALEDVFKHFDKLQFEDAKPSFNPAKLVSELRQLNASLDSVRTKFDRVLAMNDEMENELKAKTAALEESTTNTLEYLVKTKK